MLIFKKTSHSPAKQNRNNQFLTKLTVLLTASLFFSGCDLDAASIEAMAHEFADKMVEATQNQENQNNGN